MTKRLRLLLTCAGLVVLVAAGLFYALSAGHRAPAASESFSADAGKAAADKADRMTAEILKRPLFTMGRQPPQPKIVKAEPPKLQGRLAGVVMQAGLRQAVFTRPGGRPISVKEGEVVDGWTASKIEENQVVLTSSFGEQIVKLTKGSPDEITPGQRPVRKATPTKNQNNKPGTPKNPPPGQRPQQVTQALAARLTGPR